MKAPSSVARDGVLPATLAAAFQEYEISQLDLVRDRELIIERVLALGNRAEIRWLFRTYSQAMVTSWLREMGHRRLPWRRYTLWCVLLDIPRQPRRTGVWPH
jgi:hypothetical protein